MARTLKEKLAQLPQERQQKIEQRTKELVTQEMTRQ